MKNNSSKLRAAGCAVLLLTCGAGAGRAEENGKERLAAYVLGPDDQISLRVVDSEELNEKQFRVDNTGWVRLPTIGRIRAEGRTVQQFETEVGTQLRQYLKNPDVSVSVVEFRSQPVSVIGAVKNPGVVQLQGRKSLVEVLSAAGGLEPDAGAAVIVTRGGEWGAIPFPTAKEDAGTGFSVAEIPLKAIVQAKEPGANLIVKPHDVVSVPRAEMVYVVGQVQKAGGFVLNARETISVLKALSLAGGLDRAAAPQNAKILRNSDNGRDRAELPVDLKKVLVGKAPDVPMHPEDILFIPGSAPKKAASRAIEAAIQAGTGIAIFRR